MLTLDGPTTTAVAGPATKPLFLIEMGFSPAIRYSTREQYTWNTYTWLAADIQIQDGEAPILRIFNEGTTFGAAVLAQGTAGKTCKIWQAYWTGSVYTDPILIFSGEMGDATIADFVTIRCKLRPPNRTPRLYAVPPTFNHVPVAGTKINWRGQVIVLEG